MTRGLSNAHVHSSWCDGENTAREMAKAACAARFSALGYSSHAPANYETGFPGVGDTAAYRAEIAAVKEEYSGKLAVFCGLEQDDYSLADRRGAYDYIIHSVHYFPMIEGRCDPVDRSSESARATFVTRYGGDGLAMAEDYFELLAFGVRTFKPDIVGHYDLITKFNSAGFMFDESSKAYMDTAVRYLDDVIETAGAYGGMIEVNTSGMRYRADRRPYAGAPFLLRRLREKKARVIITADSHSAEGIAYKLADARLMLKAAGFTSMAVLTESGFCDVAI